MASTKAQKSSGGHVNPRLTKDGHLCKYSRTPLSRTERRYVMLTEAHLHWFRGEAGWGLLGEQVGSMAIKDIRKVRPTHKKHQPAFEVCGRLRRRWVFLTQSAEERDEWVWAIQGAIRALECHSTEVSDIGEEETSERQDRRRAIEAESMPSLQMVTRRTGNQEVVVWRNPQGGNVVDLGPLGTDDAVLLWLSTEAHAYVSGMTIGHNLDTPDMKARSSDGRATLHISFHCTQRPTPWFRHRDFILAWLAAVIGLAVAHLGVAVIVMCYAAYVAMRQYSQAQGRLGDVTMTIGEVEACSEPRQVPVPMGVMQSDRPEWYEESPVPRMFLDGCRGDVVEATKKWEAVRKWRDELQVDKILERPHPNFHRIRQHWPEFLLANARNGDAVYLDRTDKVKIPKLLGDGLTVDDLSDHMLFMTEYMMKHVLVDPTQSRFVLIYDLLDGKLLDLTPQTLQVFKKASSLLQQNYVGRERAVLFINVPSYFPMIWRLIKPAFNETVRERMHVASKADTFKLMSRFMDSKDIPAEYGGELQCEGGIDANRHLFQNDVRLVQYVDSLNALNESSSDCTTHA